MDRGAWQAIVHGVAKSRTGLGDQHFHFHTVKDSRCGYNLHRVRLVLRIKNLSYRLQMRKSWSKNKDWSGLSTVLFIVFVLRKGKEKIIPERKLIPLLSSFTTTVQGPINLCSEHCVETEARWDTLKLDTVHADCSDHSSEVLSPKLLNIQEKNALNLGMKVLSTHTQTSTHRYTCMWVCVRGCVCV